MGTALYEWLGAVGASAFRWSALAFLLVNGAAIAAVVLTRDRGLVNRWTARILGVNLLLLGSGLGIPMVTSVSRVMLASFVPGIEQVIPVIQRDRESIPVRPEQP